MKDIYKRMNNQNILKFYGTKLDIKLDSSEYYDYELTKLDDDYNKDVLNLSIPIVHTGLTINDNLTDFDCNRETIGLFEDNVTDLISSYVYSGLSFILDYNDFVNHFGNNFINIILESNRFKFTLIDGEVHYFRIGSYNLPNIINPPLDEFTEQEIILGFTNDVYTCRINIINPSACCEQSPKLNIKPWAFNFNSGLGVDNCSPILKRRTEKGWTLDFIFNREGLPWGNGGVFYYLGVRGEDDVENYSDNNLSFQFTSDRRIKWVSHHYSGYCGTDTYQEEYYISSGQTPQLCTIDELKDFNVTIVFDRYKRYTDCNLENDGGFNDMKGFRINPYQNTEMSGVTSTQLSVWDENELLTQQWANERQRRLGTLKIYLNGRPIYKIENWEEIIPSERGVQPFIQSWGGGTKLMNNIHNGVCCFNIKSIKYYENPLGFIHVRHNFLLLQNQYDFFICGIGCADNVFGLLPTTPTSTPTPTPSATITPTPTLFIPDNDLIYNIIPDGDFIYSLIPNNDLTYTLIPSNDFSSTFIPNNDVSFITLPDNDIFYRLIPNDDLTYTLVPNNDLSYLLLTPTPTETPISTETPTPTPTPTETPTPTPTPTPELDPNGYRYYKWEISDTRLPNNQVQSSEFVFIENGLDNPMTGITMSNPNGDNPIDNVEGANKIIDNNINTKWFDQNFIGDPYVLIFDFGTQKIFTSYKWATGNDLTQRDPKNWIIYGSNDDLLYRELSVVNNYVSTESRSSFNDIINFDHIPSPTPTPTSTETPTPTPTETSTPTPTPTETSAPEGAVLLIEVPNGTPYIIFDGEMYTSNVSAGIIKNQEYTINTDNTSGRFLNWEGTNVHLPASNSSFTVVTITGNTASLRVVFSAPTITPTPTPTATSTPTPTPTESPLDFTISSDCINGGVIYTNNHIGGSGVYDRGSGLYDTELEALNEMGWFQIMNPINTVSNNVLYPNTTRTYWIALRDRNNPSNIIAKSVFVDCGPTPTSTPTPTPTPTPIELIDPILISENNEYLSVGTDEYLKFFEP